MTTEARLLVGILICIPGLLTATDVAFIGCDTDCRAYHLRVYVMLVVGAIVATLTRSSMYMRLALQASKGTAI